jgi:ABC-type branched-subunit amino acid transport system ATPase component
VRRWLVGFSAACVVVLAGLAALVAGQALGSHFRSDAALCDILSERTSTCLRSEHWHRVGQDLGPIGTIATIVGAVAIVVLVVLRIRRGTPGAVPLSSVASAPTVPATATIALGFPTGPARLEVANLGVTFGGVRAVDDVSFVAEPGSIVGLIGANGSGKTTTLDMISGLVKPQHGKVWLDGVDMDEYLPEERQRVGMIRSFQDCRLYPALSVHDVLMLCEDAKREVAVLATTLQMPWARRAEAAKRRAVEQVIGAFGLDRFRDHRTTELSTGTRRVVDLASIVLASPRLLILDEPTAGIAQREAEAFIPLLQRIHDVADTTIILVEHDVPLVFELCSVVVVMELGRVVAAGPPDVVRSDPQALMAYLGASDEALMASGPVRSSTTSTGK